MGKYSCQPFQNHRSLEPQNLRGKNRGFKVNEPGVRIQNPGERQLKLASLQPLATGFRPLVSDLWFVPAD
jgi:hypothetical protein